MVNISTTRTFSLSQEDVLGIVAEYLSKNQGIEVTADQMKLEITDSSRGGYYENEYVPAKIKSISVTVQDPN